VKKQEGWCGEDPAFALAAIYLYFFTYFTVERLMHGGNQHLGVSDEQAIERFVDLLSHGVWHSTSAREAAAGAGNKPSAAVRDRESQSPSAAIAGAGGA
jgi:hypothetical protein